MGLPGTGDDPTSGSKIFSAQISRKTGMSRFLRGHRRLFERSTPVYEFGFLEITRVFYRRKEGEQIAIDRYTFCRNCRVTERVPVVDNILSAALSFFRD